MLPEVGEGKTGAEGQRQKLPVRTQESGRGRGPFPRAPSGNLRVGKSSCGSSNILVSWRQVPGRVVVTEEVEDGKLPRGTDTLAGTSLENILPSPVFTGEVTVRPSEAPSEREERLLRLCRALKARPSASLPLDAAA